jgi:hypothetical protein
VRQHGDRLLSGMAQKPPDDRRGSEVAGYRPDIYVRFAPYLARKQIGSSRPDSNASGASSEAPAGQQKADRRTMMGHSEYDPVSRELRAWNAGRKLGAKRALKPQRVWAIRFWLDRERRLRDRVLFDLAIDSKLRGCDVVKVRVGDFVSGGRMQYQLIGVIPASTMTAHRPKER